MFRPRRKPEGEYRAKIVKADDHQPNDKSKPAGWVLTVMVEGDARSTYPVYLNPEQKQAWKIYQVCRAAGLNVKTARVRFDPNKLVGKNVGIFLEDDEYEGRPKSVIAEFIPYDEVGANADEDGIDDEDEIIDEDEPEEDEPEPEPAPKKRVARKRQPEPEPEEDEEEEEEDEDEEPAPPPRKRTAAKKAAAPTRRRKPAPEPEPEDDEEDEDLDLDDLDDE